MRVITSLLSVSLLLACIADGFTQPADSFIIQGDFKNLPQGATIYLRYRVAQSYRLDSAEANNGSFRFTGMIAQAVKARLWSTQLVADPEEETQRDEISFYLEPGNFSLSGHQKIHEATVKGMREQQVFEELEQLLAPDRAALKVLHDSLAAAEQATAPNEETLKGIRKRSSLLYINMSRTEIAFVKAHPDARVSLDILEDRSTLMENFEEIDSCYQGLSDRLKNTTVGQTLGAGIETTRKSLPGKKAILIIQHNPSDSLVSLASFQGKYVLVEFWASWCGNCRTDFPELLSCYNKYKEKNFIIFAVSLDAEKEPWKKAIAEDNMPWIHVSDLKGWKNKAANEYGIMAIPQNVLIDPAGIIVAKNLYGVELDKTLYALFNF